METDRMTRFLLFLKAPVRDGIYWSLEQSRYRFRREPWQALSYLG